VVPATRVGAVRAGVEFAVEGETLEDTDVHVASSQLVAQLERRLSLPRAKSSAADFEGMSAALEEEAATIEETDPGPDMTDESILAKTHRRMEWLAKEAHDLPLPMRHLALGAVVFFRLRLMAGSLSDYVEILHVTLGTYDEHLRAHDGDIFFWGTDVRVWMRFEGLIPQHVLQLAKTYFFRIGGLFRSFSHSTERTELGILREIMRLFRAKEGSEEEFLRELEVRAIFDFGRPKGSIFARASSRRVRARAMSVAREADEPGRLDDAENTAEAVDTLPAEESVPVKGPWTYQFACHLNVAAARMEQLLYQRRLLQYYAEWCARPRPQLKGCGYVDCAYGYRADGASCVSRLTPLQRRDLYLGIPHRLYGHRLSDPVLAEARRRIKLFYSQTFWANANGYAACMAAMTLAKHGENIDRVFFMYGPGGVGLSLTTHHLDAMLGPVNHRYFDPQVFYMDDEMRKQVVPLVGAFVFTAQERPEGMGKFRNHQFKKWASADGIFGRLPYAILTKVIHLVGWKRMELNSLIRIEGVTEANFHSIFRRGLIIRFKSRFMDAEEYKKLPAEASAAGVFAQESDLRAFLRSDPAVLAGLRLQHAFESRNSRDQCEGIIADYVCRGGDDGKTNEYLRVACGLAPLKSEQPAAPSNAAAVEPMLLGLDLALTPPDEAREPNAPDDAARHVSETRDGDLACASPVSLVNSFRGIERPMRCGLKFPSRRTSTRS